MALPTSLSILLLTWLGHSNIVLLDWENEEIYERSTSIIEEAYLEDSNEVQFMSREKRQSSASGIECTRELFKRTERCCRLPEVVSLSALRACTAPPGLYPIGVVVNPALPDRTIRTEPARLCWVDCIFRYNKWIYPGNNSFDSVKIYNDLSQNLGERWQSLYPTGVVGCVALVSGGIFNVNSITVTTFLGNKCLVAPTQFMRCLKRYLTMNCVAYINTDADCQANLKKVEDCDPKII